MHGEVDRRIQGSFAIDDQEMNIYSIQCGRVYLPSGVWRNANTTCSAMNLHYDTIL